MKRLSELEAPALAGVVRERTAAAAIAEMKNCHFDGADLIDLHLSCLENDDSETLRRVIGASRLPVLALNYNSKYDWSGAGYSEEERVESLLRAVRAGAAGADIQGYTFDPASKNGFCGEDKYSFTKGNPKEIVTDRAVIEKQCELIGRIHEAGAEVLISCHPGIAMTSLQVVELAAFLEQRKPDIIKIVTIADTEEDAFEAVKAMRVLKREIKTPVSYHAGGARGQITRILNPVLGGKIAFCVDKFCAGSTMEQLDLHEAKILREYLKKLL